jgi:hypothetical protein
MTDAQQNIPLLSSSDLSPELMEALDHAAATAPDQPGRAGLIRRVLSEWLHAKGHMRRRGCDEGKRPEELTSENDL